MKKTLPLVALALSAIALVLAGISHSRLPSPTREGEPQGAVLTERLRMLERKYADLEKAHQELVAKNRDANSNWNSTTAAADDLDDGAARQEALERLAKGIDKLGLIKAMEEDVRKARATLMDESLPVWNRIKVADKLKALGQFDDEAVGAMKKVWKESSDFNDMAGALKGLNGFIDAEFGDEILLALQQELDEGNPSPRFRAAAVEALAPMMDDDQEVEEWVRYIATSDPEPRLQGFASKFFPIEAAPPPPPPSDR